LHPVQFPLLPITLAPGILLIHPSIKPMGQTALQKGLKIKTELLSSNPSKIQLKVLDAIRL
jgi:hypothetical protein